MAQNPTSDQVLEAASGLGQAEFTRADIAGKLGVEKGELKFGFREARQSGRMEKVRNDENNIGIFKLTPETP